MPEDTEKEVKKPGFWRIFKKICAYATVLFIILILAICTGGYWLTQTKSGQEWLIAKINTALAPQGDEPGYSITSLQGSIPFNFKFGMEAIDKHGVWLKSEGNELVWNWRALPSSLHLEKISLPAIALDRFPDFPPNPEDDQPQKEPMTLLDYQKLLNQIADFLNKKYWWLPKVQIDEIAVAAMLPEDFMPSTKGGMQRLGLNAKLTADFNGSSLAANLDADLRNCKGAFISLPTIDFDQLGLNIKLSAGTASDGLKADCEINGELNKPVLELASLPADVLGDNASLSIKLNADAQTGVQPGLAVNLVGPGLNAGLFKMGGNGSFQSDAAWTQGKFAGPLDYQLTIDLAPSPNPGESLLKLLASPASLALKVAGNLPSIDADLELACAKLLTHGYTFTDTSLKLAARDIELPLNDQALHALEAENHLACAIATTANGNKADLNVNLFFQELANARGWRLGLRDLAIQALGANGTGNLAVILPDKEKPGIDGKLNIQIKNWAELEKFLPGQKLTGQIELDTNLASGLTGSVANPVQPAPADLPAALKSRQTVIISLTAPQFSMVDKSGSGVRLAKINAMLGLQDLFANPAVDANLTADKIEAAGLSLKAEVAANGPIAGPLKAKVKSSGSINSSIQAQWQPGEAELSQLELQANLSPLLKDKSRKNMMVGLKASKPAKISYGEQGIRISQLDLTLLPGGKLIANGGVSPKKLDFKLNLEEFNFKAWQAIVPQLPGGSASLTATLEGTPQAPAGQFKLGLKNVALPKSSVGPISLNLLGKITHSRNISALTANLELDPATVKALGGRVAQVNASIPLLFGSDGIPKPYMEGPLAAQIRWDGALGPIWNLLPIADRRLNGRILIDMKAGGTLAKPKLNGQAQIGKARYEDLLLGILLTDINLDLELLGAGEPGKIRGALDSLPGSIRLKFSLSDGRGGTLTANGSGKLDGNDLNIKAKINDLRPLRRRDIHIQLSGNASVTGTALAPKIDGEIIVDKGEVLLNNLDFTASVTTLPITEPGAIIKEASKKTAAPASKEEGSLNVKITMLPRFTVEGRGLASLWKANLLVTGPLTDPKIIGNISSVRGNFDFLGKIFALTKGIVFFGGGSISNPLVDIDLTHETTDLTAHILVTGPVNKVKLQLTSDPQIPRDEILSRVLFGRSVNDLSRMEMLQLAGAVAQLAGFGGGTGPLGMAKKALGVDVLRIGTADSSAPNQSTEDTGGGTTIEAGKYINDYIYMGVQQGFKPDSTAFIIEIEITPRAGFELRSDQNNTWGGFKWKYSY